MTQHIDAHDPVIEYFRDKAAVYDLVDQQLYWQLSDALLWTVLRETALSRVPPGFRLLDAGGGTGRWTQRILTAYPDCTATLFDLSVDMVAEARRKMADELRNGRLATTIGDLGTVSQVLGTGRFDLVTCFHNVIGFVENPESVIAELARTLAPGGRLVLFAPNKYHVAYFNLSRGEVDMAGDAIAERGRFTLDMPEMALFTLPTLVDACTAAGLEIEVGTGFPVLLYPGYEETRVEGTSAGARNVLSDATTFEQVFALERKAMAEPQVAARGNNLYVVARKH